MREEQGSPEQLPYLGGYLRCTFQGCTTPTHYWPVDVTIKIARRQGEPRTFGPTLTIFEHPDRSCGMRLTLPEEDSTKMRLGQAPYDQPRANDIVIDDTLNVIVTVNYK